MDNTVLTIIGMIAAFITASVTAFLAEPVKSYFVEKTKLQNIRLSLYKEIAQNSFFLNSLVKAYDDENIDLVLDWMMFENWVSTKCYDGIVKQSVDDYYRLDDVIFIDTIYKWIKMLIIKSERSEEIFGEDSRDYAIHFVEDVSDGLKSGMLNKKIMLRAVSEKRIDELLNPSSLKREIH